MRTTLLCGLAVTLSTQALAQTDLPTYTAEDLGRLAGFTYATTPRGLNDLGTVVGHCASGSATHRAFIRGEGGALTALPLPPGAGASSSTFAVDINNNGQIVGYTENPQQVWVFNSATSQFTMIPMPAGQSPGEPRAINNNGEVVGWCADTMNLRSFYWSAATGSLDPTGGLTYADLTDINDHGLIVGSHDGIGKSWDRRTGQHSTYGMLAAPYDDRAQIEAVNNEGVAVGWCRWVASSSSTTIRRGFMLDTSSGQMFDLGAVNEAAADAARAISDTGMMIGTTGTTASNSAFQHAWVMSPLGSREFLSSLTTPALVWDNFDGTFARINSRGQVIVSGTLLNGLDRSRRGVLLTPLPACGTSDFNGDGDFGTDQDIEAFFACLAGTCCPTCHARGADFNGDGDFGTDQDIEAFFRVLAGGSC